MTDPKWLETNIVRTFCDEIGYGRVMQIAADLWRTKDPIGALTVGPPADPKQDRVDSSIAKQLQASIERNARMVTRLKALLQTCNHHQPSYETYDAASEIEAILKDQDPT